MTPAADATASAYSTAGPASILLLKLVRFTEDALIKVNLPHGDMQRSLTMLADALAALASDRPHLAHLLGDAKLAVIALQKLLDARLVGERWRVTQREALAGFLLPYLRQAVGEAIEWQRAQRESERADR